MKLLSKKTIMHLRKLENLSNLVDCKLLKKWKFSPTHAHQWESIPHHKAEFCKTGRERVEGSGRRAQLQLAEVRVRVQLVKVQRAVGLVQGKTLKHGLEG